MTAGHLQATVCILPPPVVKNGKAIARAALPGKNKAGFSTEASSCFLRRRNSFPDWT